VAFAAQSEHIRSLLFNFDSVTDRISASGQPVSSPGMTAFEENLSRDAKKIAFCVVRAGTWELWEKSLVDEREAPVITDDDRRIYLVARWPAPGIYSTKISYKLEPDLIWSVDNRTETPLTALSDITPIIYDWSANGEELLLSQNSGEGDREEGWRLPVAAAPHAEAKAQKIISDPAYEMTMSKVSGSIWILDDVDQ
jgi:hypothetical protein